MTTTSAAGNGPRIVLYSDDRNTRRDILTAVGPRLGIDEPDIDWVETATGDAVVEQARTGEIDLFILDGEAAKIGGIGLARQLKDEIEDCAPVVLLIGRPVDAWLGSWSHAEFVISHPLDPMEVHQTVVRALDPVVLSK